MKKQLPDYNLARLYSLRLGASDFGYSNRKNKRFMVIYEGKKIHFGDPEMDNYLIHQDQNRKKRFHQRFRNFKNINNPYSSLYWSANVLW
jgi:hypothetical protein